MECARSNPPLSLSSTADGVPNSQCDGNTRTEDHNFSPDEVGTHQPFMPLDFSLVGGIEASNDLMMSDVFTGEDLDQPTIREFWNYLHTSNIATMQPFPFSEYQELETIGMHNNELFQANWGQMELGDIPNTWNEADFEVLWNHLGEGDISTYPLGCDNRYIVSSMAGHECRDGPMENGRSASSLRNSPPIRPHSI
ncbi:hypothetical protein N7532_007037 [Penicillium argentinense]|uniref:Uncharacterized protein n=1 Tax=Penicillium argentinense TaxID=1131581 RepID=A0A9W9KBV1_9EURO|nr:uncharacterized protein N7532_007037 [Penicillium argentinense]KAJ5100036.1 hypothetical protein N7532_007037 [Penicillium argentinense]